jgi:histidinol-phosphate aminotransferase
MTAELITTPFAGAPPAPRPGLAHVPAYVPEPPAAPPEGPAYRLFLNENPHPPLASVQQVLVEALRQVNLYPPIMPDRLVRRLSGHLDVPPESITTGPGSIGVYQQIGRAFLAEGDEVVYPWLSFEAFPIVARVAAARAVEVPLEGHHCRLAEVARRITDRTRMVLLCNPNNPTGTAFSGAELADFLDAVPARVLVVIDDAYHEFADPGQVAHGVAAARTRANVIALRTFSKAYGLAGLRVGYGVAHPVLAEAMRKCSVPCAISTVAEEAALASLDAEEELLDRVRQIAAERDRVLAGLSGLGWPAVPSETNFVWLPLAAGTAQRAAHLAAAGVLTRAFPDHGIRVSIGSPAANDHILAVAKTLR